MKHRSRLARMDEMNEHSPESAANGSGGPLADLAPWSDASTGAAQVNVTETAGPSAEQARQPAMMDDLCRLTLCGPSASAELAVPAHVPLIDLLPALVGHLGDGLADAGLEHGGWVLQRLGDPPLREELSAAALGLRDGEVVHLRPRAEQLPPLDFDDLIDGVANTISTRPDRWRPDMSRRLLVGLLAVPLPAGLAVLARHLGTLSELAAAARGGRPRAVVATAVAGMFLAVGGALATVARLDVAATAGILLALIVPFGGWTPMIAFRLASMRLDATPSTPDELQSDLDPVPGQQVIDSTRRADRYMTALYSGLAVVVTGCLIVLGVAAGWRARLVAIDVIALLLLHSRVLVAARHRLAVLVPAVCGAAVLVTAAGFRADSRSWLTVFAGLVVAAGLLLTGERLLPGHKLLPHWGRAGDLLHTLTAVALIPGVLWLLN